MFSSSAVRGCFEFEQALEERWPLLQAACGLDVTTEVDNSYCWICLVGDLLLSSMVIHPEKPTIRGRFLYFVPSTEQANLRSLGVLV